MGVLGQDAVLTVPKYGARKIGPREEADIEEAGIRDRSADAGFVLPDSRKRQSRDEVTEAGLRWVFKVQGSLWPMSPGNKALHFSLQPESSPGMADCSRLLGAPCARMHVPFSSDNVIS